MSPRCLPPPGGGSHALRPLRSLPCLPCSGESTPLRPPRSAPLHPRSYAATMASLSGEPVYLVEFYLTDPEPPVRWDSEGVMSIRVAAATVEANGHSDAATPAAASTIGAPAAVWIPVRACFRYVTQRPWSRLPVVSKTRVLNPVICCLAGGRNKLMASKAYDFFNGEFHEYGLTINVPETIQDVAKVEVPLYVKRFFGGHAVVKVPYGNAGQGVYTILSKEELDSFMAEDHHYGKFIVQSLVGSANWGSVSST